MTYLEIIKKIRNTKFCRRKQISSDNLSPCRNLVATTFQITRLSTKSLRKIMENRKFHRATKFLVRKLIYSRTFHKLCIESDEREWLKSNELIGKIEIFFFSNFIAETDSRDRTNPFEQIFAQLIVHDRDRLNLLNNGTIALLGETNSQKWSFDTFQPSRIRFPAAGSTRNCSIFLAIERRFRHVTPTESLEVDRAYRTIDEPHNFFIFAISNYRN